MILRLSILTATCYLHNGAHTKNTSITPSIYIPGTYLKQNNIHALTLSYTQGWYL